jgi:hypothetical protein
VSLGADTGLATGSFSPYLVASMVRPATEQYIRNVYGVMILLSLNFLSIPKERKTPERATVPFCAGLASVLSGKYCQQVYTDSNSVHMDLQGSHS